MSQEASGQTESGAVIPAAAPRRARIARLAPAKLNLTLAVLRLLPNGYHALHSVAVPLALADELVVELAPDLQTSPDRLSVKGFDAGPLDANLVLRAIEAARLAVWASWPGAPGTPPPLRVRLVKKIPVAAGLGGGSSDAASAMDAALEAWDATLGADAALEVAAGLGSDVPFFLAGGAAAITGRGDEVRPLRGVVGPQPGVLLVTPAMPLPTPAVYGVLDAGVRATVPGAARLASEHLAAELARGMTARQLMDRAGVLASANDLTPAAVAIAPSLLVFRRALARLLDRPVGQTGSGPTVWVLYPTLDDARKAARIVARAVADGRLPAAGDGPPFVTATTFLTDEKPEGTAAAADPQAGGEDTTHDTGEEG